MADATAKDREPALGGVPLIQYAAICAAIREGFELERVLEVEGVEAERWVDIETLWKIELVENAATFARYQMRLAEAEDRLGRPISPLDADLDAWIAFLGVCAGASAAEVLEKNGLGPNDLARLQRRWDAKMKADASIAKRAVKIRERKPPPSLPRVRSLPSTLEPTPTALAQAAARAKAIEKEREEPIDKEALARADAIGIDEVARLWAELDDVKPDKRALICERFGFKSVAAVESVLRDLTKRMEKDRALRNDVRSLRAHHSWRIEDRRYAAEREAYIAQSIEALPRAPIAEAAPLGLCAPTIDDETRDVDFDLLEIATLPFADEEPKAAPIAEDRPSASMRRIDAHDATRDVDSHLLEVPTLPFEGASTREKPRAGAHDESLLAELAPTLVWEPSDKKNQSAAKDAVEWTLEQYASLRAELSVSKKDKANLLKRYGLASDEELERLNRQWLRRTVRDPALVANLRKLVETYIAYLERRT